MSTQSISSKRYITERVPEILSAFYLLTCWHYIKKNRNTECLTRNIKGLLKMKFSDLNTLLKKLLTTFEVICYLYYIVLLLLKVFQFYPNRISIDLDILSALFTDIPQCRLVFTSCAIWKNADLRNISALAHPKHYRWFSYECFLLDHFVWT